MRFALMQPYFFPYSGYFSLIESVDVFMFFDEVQYVRKSWMSRNRLKNPFSGEVFYIRPELVKPEYKSSLGEVLIKPDSVWKSKLLQQMRAYKNMAPFYEETISALSKFLNDDNSDKLVEFCTSSISWLVDYLELNTQIRFYSQLEQNLGELNPESWSLEVSKIVGADMYVNSPGGSSFIEVDSFSSAGIKLGFIQPNLSSYPQGKTEFVEGLSILDLLFYLGKEGAQNYVQDYSIDWKN